jgi:hypothetical protein
MNAGLFGDLAVCVSLAKEFKHASTNGRLVPEQEFPALFGYGKLAGGGISTSWLARIGDGTTCLPVDWLFAIDIIFERPIAAAECFNHLVRGNSGQEVHQIVGTVESISIGRDHEKRRPNCLQEINGVILPTKATGQVSANNALDVRAKAVENHLRSHRTAGPSALHERLEFLAGIEHRAASPQAWATLLLL